MLASVGGAEEPLSPVNVPHSVLAYSALETFFMATDAPTGAASPTPIASITAPITAPIVFDRIIAPPRALRAGRAHESCPTCARRWSRGARPQVRGPVPRMVAEMLRHVLLIRLKQGVTVDQVDAFVHAITEVPFPGRNNVVIGRDLGIRQGNMDLAVSNDFPDEATYRAWGDDPEHVRVREAFLAPIADRIERCLFSV